MSEVTVVRTTLAESTREALEIAFDGYCSNASGDQVVSDFAEAYARNLDFYSEIRIFFGTSGAMRWPWSQEAPIRFQNPKIG